MGTISGTVLPSRRHPRLEFGEPILDDVDLCQAGERGIGVGRCIFLDPQEPLPVERPDAVLVGFPSSHSIRSPTMVLQRVAPSSYT